MVFLIFLQSALFLSTMLSGGVITEMKRSAFDFLRGRVETRAAFLESQMRKHWSSFAPTAEKMRNLWNQTRRESALPTDEMELKFLSDAMPRMIAMLRSTSATGVFLILNDDSKNAGAFPAVYLRDYDPAHGAAMNDDLYLLNGPPEISRQFQISTERGWSRCIDLNDKNGEFFYKARDDARQFSSPARSGYWCASFQPLPEDSNVITYSVPLVDEEGKVFGVMGVEIMPDHLRHFLPDDEIDRENRWGYMLGLRGLDADEIIPVVLLSEKQKRVMENAKPLKSHVQEINRAVAALKHPRDGSTVFASIRDLRLYDDAAPRQEAQWVLIGLSGEKSLMRFVDQTNRILTISFFCVLVMGTLLAFWGSRYFTEPIAELARQVRKTKGTEPVSLKRTGLAEIDRLAGEIETLNRDVLDSSLRVAEIIRMVDAPIGAFEYRGGADTVLGTELLLDIMELKSAVRVDLYGTHVNKDVFFQKLESIMKYPALDEEDIYRCGETNHRWLRIKLNRNEHGILGILIDVTQEVERSNRIKYERDRDAMTGLYNSSAFCRIVEKILAWENLTSAAFVMLDLDRLKYINDTYGHDVGDHYITKTAEFLKGMTIRSAVFGRRSGDEFYAFFYQYQSKEQVRKAMREFYEKLRQNPIRMPDGRSFAVQISAGISWYKEHSADYHELIRFADFAMYKAKFHEKGTYLEFDRQSYEREMEYIARPLFMERASHEE